MDRRILCVYVFCLLLLVNIKEWTIYTKIINHIVLRLVIILSSSLVLKNNLGDLITAAISHGKKNVHYQYNKVK